MCRLANATQKVSQVDDTGTTLVEEEVYYTNNLGEIDSDTHLLNGVTGTYYYPKNT